MYIVYVLKSKVEKKSYVGLTDDISRRLREHNSGKSTYTKRYLPWEIVYKEEFNNFLKARERERFLKSTTGRRFLKKIFKNQHCGVV